MKSFLRKNIAYIFRRVYKVVLRDKKEEKYNYSF